MSLEPMVEGLKFRSLLLLPPSEWHVQLSLSRQQQLSVWLWLAGHRNPLRMLQTLVAPLTPAGTRAGS